MTPSNILNLPLDILYEIDDQLLPAAKFAFRLTCTALYTGLPRCILQNLPEDADESQGRALRKHKIDFLLLKQNDQVTPCTSCCRLHRIRNVFRHPSWRDEFPYEACLNFGTFCLCPCINITVTDAWYLWNSFWDQYDVGAHNPTALNYMAHRVKTTGDFTHQCWGGPHPLFSNIEITVRGYMIDISPGDYHRRFGARPTFQMCFDMEWQFTKIFPKVLAGPHTDPIKICPHMSLLHWDHSGNYEFNTKEQRCQICRTIITFLMDLDDLVTVKVTRAYGNSVGHLLPYPEGLENPAFKETGGEYYIEAFYR